MRYQLVLQFKGDSLMDYDTMIAVEDQLIERLGRYAEVDGHDMGSGEANIFIVASDPRGTFDRIKPVLQRAMLLSSVSVAYRPVGGVECIAIWPALSQGFTVA